MVDISKIKKEGNIYYPFEREEFFSLFQKCSWGDFRKKKDERLKSIKEKNND